MKRTLSIVAVVLLLGALGAWTNAPWWFTAVWGAVGGAWFARTNGQSFWASFLGGFLLWLSFALARDIANGGILSARVGALFMGLPRWGLWGCTGLIGGLIGGLGGLTGHRAKQWRTALISKRQHHLPLWVVALTALLPREGAAQIEEIVEIEKSAWLWRQAVLERGTTSGANNRLDIQYCRAHWVVDPAVRYIRGTVAVVFELTEFATALEFDFSEALIMDSILYRGQPLVFNRQKDVLTVHFPAALPPFVRDSIVFYYQGAPPRTGFGSFEVSQHNGVPVLWTLSEPYGARDWWPCKQSLDDKIDSIDIYITTSAAYRAASNGLLQSEVVHCGQRTAHWKHRYPIAAYLVALAVTNYEVFSDLISVGQDTILMVNYVYPESVSAAQNSMSYLGDQLRLFSALFGKYPFAAEKYGHAQFGWGGGMEHQTMSFMGNFGFELVAHELAHQWFGNKITCGSWADIWLNEGFATYLSGLCYEHLLPQYWHNFKQVRINSITSQPGGSLRVDDTTNINRIFSGRLSYAKGAMVLHMLRWICGDSLFFSAVRNYLNDPELAYGYAHTPALKAHFEAVLGRSLDYFFDDWYTGEGYPSYQVKWWQGSDGTVYAQIDQTQSSAAVSFFELPVPLRLKGANGEVLDARLDHTFSGQLFTIPADFEVVELLIDPDLWLISRDNSAVRISSTPLLESDGFTFQVAPNPTPSPVRIWWECARAVRATYSLWTAEGRLIALQTADLPAGRQQTDLVLPATSAGTYLLRVQADGKEWWQKVGLR